MTKSSLGVLKRDLHTIVPKCSKALSITDCLHYQEPREAALISSRLLGWSYLLEFDHHAINHGVGEYVRDMAHTNGIEGFWSMLKRSIMGIFHKISHKHLDRYVTEFAGRHNTRILDTIDIMVGKRLRYQDLVWNGR